MEMSEKSFPQQPVRVRVFPCVYVEVHMLAVRVVRIALALNLSPALLLSRPLALPLAMSPLCVPPSFSLSLPPSLLRPLTPFLSPSLTCTDASSHNTTHTHIGDHIGL